MKYLLKSTISLLLMAALIPLSAYSENDGDDGGATVQYIETSVPEFISECNRMLGSKSNWEGIISTARGQGDIAAKFKKHLDEKFEEIKANIDEGDEEEKKNKIADEMTPIVEMAAKCTGFIYVISFRDVGDTEQMAKARIKKSGDRKIRCENTGIQAIDYDRCSDAIDAYDIAAVAEMGMQAYQQIDYASTTSTANQEYMNDVNNPVGALVAQKKGIEKQAEIANTQAGLHTAKAGSMWYQLSEMPSIEDLNTHCKGLIKNSEATISGKKGWNENYGVQMAAGYDPVHLCTNVLNSTVNFLPNAGAQDQMKRAIAGDTALAVVKVAEGALLNNQASKLNDAVDSVHSFDPSEIGYANAVTDPCLADPSAEGCMPILDESVDFANNGFSVGGGWGGSNSTGANSDRDENFDPTAGEGDPSFNDPTSSMGVAVANNSSKGGFAGRPPGAAGVKSSGGASIGSGGGGGGGAGSASAPGGSGSGGRRGAMGGPEGKLAKASYAGGASGVGYAGGSRSKTSSKKKSSNPFGSLFNKNKKGEKSSDVMNFRGVASKKQIGTKDGRGLFEMISSRYKSVDKRDKLLKYKTIQSK